VVNSKKINIGISIGDPNGIGIEIILKTLSDRTLYKECNFIVYSSENLIKKQQDVFKIKTAPIKKIHSVNEANDDFINIKEVFTDSKFEFGKNDRDVSEMGIISFKEAVNDSIKGEIDDLKNILNEDPMMLMVSKNLKLGLLTEHIPLKDVVKEITSKKVIKKINTLRETLKKDFLIKHPKIAILAINPHAGDNGVIGSEDQEVLMPAIAANNKNKHLTYGPFSADTFFCDENFKKYDGIIAAYHDQGLIPFKTMSFGKGVNYSAGLPIIRTSPDHGTGFDIAGKGIASSTSFLQAIKVGINIYKSRNTIV
jgi:4-hydroxythreonine-4-phosphate dehydrogenase